MAYIARYGHQPWSEMLAMSPRELQELHDDLSDIVRRENGDGGDDDEIGDDEG